MRDMKMNDDFKDTEIGRIPKEWEIKKISQVALISMGQSPPSQTYNKNKVGLPFFQGKTDFTDKYPKITIWCSKPKKIANINDILISVRAPVGDVNISPVNCCIGRGISSLKIDKSNSTTFIFYSLKYYKNFFKNISYGSTFQSINKYQLMNFKLAIPPLEEQKKIAYVLSKIQNGIEIQNKLIKSLQELKKSMMHKLFTEGIGHTEFKDTEIGRIPKEWEIKKIKDVSLKIKAGGTPSRKESKYWNGKIPFVLINDMTNSGIYLYNTKQFITELGLSNSSAWLVPKNSLLISMYATIGEAVINKISVATNQAILAIITKPCFNTEFGLYTIRYYKNILSKQNVQSTQKNVNKAIVENFEIPIPPLEEQKRIADILSAIDNKISIEERRKESFEKLFKTMLNKLMTGQIRTKNIEVMQ
jgi:type I restriction enzyme S subunit